MFPPPEKHSGPRAEKKGHEMSSIKPLMTLGWSVNCLVSVSSFVGRRGELNSFYNHFQLYNFLM